MYYSYAEKCNLVNKYGCVNCAELVSISWNTKGVSAAQTVYFGYLTEGQKHLLQRVLHRANRRGFTSHYYDLDTLAESTQYDLFHHSHHSAHCLHHLYTAKLKPPGTMRLRAHGHDFSMILVYFIHLSLIHI